MAKREVTISIKVDDKDGDAVVDRWKARFAELEDVSDAALKNINRNIGDKLSQAFAGGGEREYMETIRRLAPELKTLHDNIKNGSFDIDDYHRRMQLLDPATRTAISAANQLGSSFRDVGESAEHGTNGLGKLLVSLNLLERGIDFVKQKLGEAKDEFLLFGKEMSEISTIVDDNFDLSKARREIASLPAALGKSSELAAGFKLAVGSGIEAGNALQFTADSAKAAKGGFAEVYEVVDASTTILNSYGIAAKNVNSVYDMMFETVKSGKIEFSQLSQSVGQVTNIAAQSGVKLEEMFAVIATATATTKPATAIEAFRSALSNILKPSQEARDLAQSLGLQFDVAALRAKGFAGFLQDVMDKTEGNTDKLAILFGDVQGLNSILSITGAQAQNFAKNLNVMENATGNVDKAFQKSQDSLNAQLETFGNAFEKRIGAALAVVEPLLMLILTTVNKYPNAFTAGALAVGALTAAHLLLNTQLIISASTAIPNLIKGIVNTIAIMTSFTQVTTMSATALTAFTAGWGLVAVAIGVAAYALYNYVQSQKQTVEQQLQGIEAVKSQVDALNRQKQTLSELGSGVGDLSTRQQKLTEIYSTLSAASLDRVNSATNEKGAVGALADEIERLNRAKGLELEVKTIALVDRTAKAFEAQRAAVARADEATQTYQNSIGKLTPMMEVNAKTGIETGRVAMTVKEQFDQLGNRQAATAEEARKATEEFTNLKTALDAAARLMGVSTEQFIQAKVATGQLTQQNADFLKSLSGAANGQNTLANNLNKGTDAAKQQIYVLGELSQKLKGLMSESQGRIDERVAWIAMNAKDKAEAAAMARRSMGKDDFLYKDFQDLKRLRENEKSVRDIFEPSQSTTRSKSPNPEADFRRENRIKSGNAQWDKYVYEASARQGIDADLIFAQMQQESSFKANALSPKNAGGLMQVIPGTYERMQRMLAKQGVKISDNRFDPRSSIEAGVAYMRLLLDQFGGNTALALAGYNAGEGAVMKYGNNIPPYRETQDYVKRIAANYQKIKGGRAELGSNFDYARSLEDISDARTSEQRNAETMALIEAARQTRMMPDASVISDYNKILVEQAKKSGGLQPTLEKTQEEFKNYYLPAKPSDAAPRELTLRDADPRADRFQNLSKSLGLMADEGELNRAQQIEQRRVYLADEILIRQEDYRQSLEESNTELEVEYRLLAQRNLEIEASVEFTKQQNNQYRELQDVEVQLDALRRASADENFTSERRLLAAKREELDLRRQIADAEDALANSGVNDSLRIQVAYLQDIVELRDRETDAVIRTNRAQLELSQSMTISNNQIRAGIYDHIAGANNLNEAYIRGFNKTFDVLNSKINSSLDAFDEKTKGYLSFIIEPMKAYQTNALSKVWTSIIDTIFPTEIAQQFKSSGNPLLDENKKQTDYLKTIAGALTGNSQTLFAGSSPSIIGQPGGGLLSTIGSIITGVGGNLGNRNGVNAPYILNASGGRSVLMDSGAVFQTGSGGGSLWGNIKDLFSTKPGGLFAARNNVLTGKPSSLGGIMGGIGDIATMIAPLLGGGKLSSVVGMAGTGASIGSMFGPWGAAAGAAIGGLVGLFTGGTRKQDEQTRTQAYLAVSAEFDRMIESLNSRPPTIQPSVARSQADQIIAQYNAAMNQLKDSKTRRIALQEVTLPTGVIYRKNQQLEQAMQNALKWQVDDANRKKVSSSFTGEFAGGVYMDSSFRAQYDEFKRLNGLMPGSYTGRDYIKAIIGDGEMVLNAAQQMRVIANARNGYDNPFVDAGIPNVTKFNTPEPPRFAGGASFSSVTAPTSGNQNKKSEPDIINIDIDMRDLLDDLKSQIRAEMSSPTGKKITLGHVKARFNGSSND